ncbi:MAG: 3-dehydroquinate synthase [Parvularcula sp.]|jgi:3-dehydroquinate synthase|nr:3-dehydroquinate synthase [Parvularcula sp.]
MTERLEVALGERSYEVVIGKDVLSSEERALTALTEKPSALVADEAVYGLYKDRLPPALSRLPVVTVPPGEGSKSWRELERVTTALLKAGVERGGCVVALGGGVTGDLAGFASAVLRRGCGLVQIPTTLLSQVDSSVGGKTAINTSAGKNLVGAFHQPSLVLIDPGFLDTLPDRELRAGYAEVVKAGLLGHRALFTWLEERGGDVLARNAGVLVHAIAESCRLKAQIVAADEEERGERALLNLGHTFGHAIEAEGGYDGRTLHGEAVAIGMAMAARLSAERGLAPSDIAPRTEGVLRGAGLPTRLGHLPSIETTPERLLAAMDQDKKVEGGDLTLILLRGVGDAIVSKKEDRSAVLDFLAREALLPAS